MDNFYCLIYNLLFVYDCRRGIQDSGEKTLGTSLLEFKV